MTTLRMISLCALVAAACGDSVEGDGNNIGEEPCDAGAGSGDAGDHDDSVHCPGGGYGWYDLAGNPICVGLTVSPDGQYDDHNPAGLPPIPAPPIVSPLCTATPTGTAAAVDACPPPQYLTEFKKFKMNIVGGLGEHSGTRLSLWEATWDATLTPPAYKARWVMDADHGNHGPSPADPQMRVYGFPIRTGWTDVTGLGRTTFTNAQGKYCQCANDAGHVTSSDSCYGFLPRGQNHVCHSDTRYQEIIFRAISGNGILPANECGNGLWARNAP